MQATSEQRTRPGGRLGPKEETPSYDREPGSQWGSAERRPPWEPAGTQQRFPPSLQPRVQNEGSRIRELGLFITPNKMGKLPGGFPSRLSPSSEILSPSSTPLLDNKTKIKVHLLKNNCTAKGRGVENLSDCMTCCCFRHQLEDGHAGPQPLSFYTGANYTDAECPL